MDNRRKCLSIVNYLFPAIQYNAEVSTTTLVSQAILGHLPKVLSHLSDSKFYCRIYYSISHG